MKVFVNYWFSILFYIPLFVLIKNPIFQINVISLLVSSYWAVALTKLFTKTNINQLYLAFPVLYNIIVAIISTQIVTFFNIGIDHDKVFIVFLIFMFLINIKEIRPNTYLKRIIYTTHD